MTPLHRRENFPTRVNKKASKPSWLLALTLFSRAGNSGGKKFPAFPAFPDATLWFICPPPSASQYLALDVSGGYWFPIVAFYSARPERAFDRLGYILLTWEKILRLVSCDVCERRQFRLLFP